MLALSDQPALWDVEPEVPILPNRESSSTLDYTLGEAEEGLGPESPRLIPNHHMRQRVVTLPPILVVVLFCCTQSAVDCDLHDNVNIPCRLSSHCCVLCRFGMCHLFPDCQKREQGR